MKDYVKIKCSKKHDGEVGYFDLTPDMVMVSGNMVRTKCPICNASVILSWKSVAELLETTVEEAKAQLANGEVPKIAVVPRKPAPTMDISNTMSDEDEDERIATVRTTPVNEYTNMLTQSTTTSETPKIALRMEEPHAPSNGDSPSTIGDTMGGFNVSEMDKTTNEVLADVIRSQPGVGKAIIDEVIEYIALKPEGWPPNMVKMILEAYKVTPSVSDVIVARYGMKLNMIEQKRKGVDQLRGMLGNPGTTLPGFGGNNGGMSMPGSMGFNNTSPSSQLPGMGNMSPQINPQQMWMSYQQDPNSFFAWLTSNPQYMPVWQQTFQQMQSMGGGMANPIFQNRGMGMAPMMGMGMGMAPPSGGTSREDIRRMISGEMDQVKAAIQQVVAQNAPKPPADDTLKTLVIPMMLKMMDDKKPDSGNDFTQALLGKLLDKSLEDKGGEMQFLLNKMEEMEKRREEIARATEEARKNANPFSNVNSVDNLDTALKLHEVLGNFDIKREELKDKVKQREMWSTVIGGGLDTLGKAFSTVMMVKQGQGGAVSAPMEVPIESTVNVSSAKCDNCGSAITYAIGSTRVVCPRCNTLYDIIPNAPQPQIPPPREALGQGAIPPHPQYEGPVVNEEYSQAPENDFPPIPPPEDITPGGSNQNIVNMPPIPPPPVPAGKKRGRTKAERDGM